VARLRGAPLAAPRSCTHWREHYDEGRNGAISVELSPAQFRKIARIVHQLAGIALHDGKEELVKARLMKRLRELNINSVKEYIKYLENDASGRELAELIDIMTTNKTCFFREYEHFKFLKERVLPEWKHGEKRIWSAGCSSGEEPYSIAILLREELRTSARVKILATDISARMLKKAKEGIYPAEELKNVPPDVVRKYFTPVPHETTSLFRIKDEVKCMVRFARLNLMDRWPMKGPFDIIFCRNVMIYFDRETKEQLLQRFWKMLAPGGYLFIGHSESLAPLSSPFLYVKPAIYRKAT